MEQLPLPQKINDFLKTFFGKMNDIGIPVPLLRDPVNGGKASLSFTLMVIASLIWIIGIVGRWGNLLSVNLEEAKEFFYAAGYLYFGRSLIKTTLKPSDKKENE